jgi:hypothetical protein
MAALTSDRNTKTRDGFKFGFPVAASTVIYVGALVGINSSGYAVPMSLSTTLAIAGVCEAQANNAAGAAGAINVEVRKGHYLFNVTGTAITLANLNANVYASDDNTVTLTSTGASLVGTVSDVDSSGKVWVKIV